MSNDVYIPLQHFSTTALAWTIRNELAVVFDPIRRNIDLTTYLMSSQTSESSLPTASTTITTTNQWGRGVVRLFVPDSSASSSISTPLHQSSSSNESFSFGPNPQIIQFLAQNYRLRGNIADVCWHNAQVILRTLIPLHPSLSFAHKHRQECPVVVLW
jgi:hypothetical protein